MFDLFGIAGFQLQSRMIRNVIDEEQVSNWPILFSGSGTLYQPEAHNP